MIWPCINYVDAPAAIDFLTRAFGFVAHAVHRDGSRVVHAELLFPEGGGIMLGSAARDGTAFERLPPGASAVYVATDAPSGLYTRATKIGAKVIRELRRAPLGGSDFIVEDPEGNVWSFGDYRGEPT